MKFKVGDIVKIKVDKLAPFEIKEALIWFPFLVGKISIIDSNSVYEYTILLRVCDKNIDNFWFKEAELELLDNEEGI
jgi:hypothetical protein